MERASSSFRRGGTILLSLGSPHQEINLIISDLKSLKSHVKAMRDIQQVLFEEMLIWTNSNESNALKEMFTFLKELNKLWAEAQTEFAEQMRQFQLNFEMFLEAEKLLEAARSELSNSEAAEQKAEKKFNKLEKKKGTDEYKAAKLKLEECKKQKEFLQNSVKEKILENEAVKLIRLKNGLLKLSEAYIGLSQKCICIFEAQRDIVRALPDVNDKEIHEIKFEGLPEAENILQRARNCVNAFNEANRLSQPSAMDPPPPYSVLSNLPFNPYYISEGNPSDSQPPQASQNPGNPLYPSLGLEEELSGAVNATKI